MAEGKKIEVRIAAVGGDQAAAEVRKVENAVAGLDSSAGTTGDGIDELNQQLDEMKKRAEALKEETADVAEEQESANQAMRLGRAAAVGLGIGGATGAKIFGEIAKGLESLDVEKLREMDAAMADQVETAKGWAEILTDPLNGIQRLISGNTISGAFAEVNDQLSRNAEMQAEAIDRMIQNGRRTAAEIAALAKEIAAANAVLDAKDDADAAERDAADAARVRGGAAPEDVRAERAAFDRDRELERLNRSLDPKAAAAQAKFDDAQRADTNAARVADNPNATQEDRKKALDEAEKARKAFEEAKREYDAAKAVVTEQRRGVNARYQGEIGDAAGDKTDRLKSEREKAERKQQLEAEKKRREQEAEAERRTRDAAGIGRDAVSLIPKDASDRARAAVEAAAAKLRDGDQGGEVAALLTLVEQMASFVIKTKGEGSANAIRIKQLEADIKAMRGNQKK